MYLKCTKYTKCKGLKLEYNISNMKTHFKKSDIIAAIVITAIMASAVIYFSLTPAKVEPVCTTEYVNINGPNDCTQKAKNDADSSLEQMNNQYR
jgi:hypothetical protein